MKAHTTGLHCQNEDNAKRGNQTCVCKIVTVTETKWEIYPDWNSDNKR